MEDIFLKDNLITTNGLNILKILAVNESDICCQDLLNEDFCILSKTEHNYELANKRSTR